MPEVAEMVVKDYVEKFGITDTKSAGRNKGSPKPLTSYVSEKGTRKSSAETKFRARMDREIFAQTCVTKRGWTLIKGQTYFDRLAKDRVNYADDDGVPPNMMRIFVPPNLFATDGEEDRTENYHDRKMQTAGKAVEMSVDDRRSAVESCTRGFGVIIAPSMETSTHAVLGYDVTAPDSNAPTVAFNQLCDEAADKVGKTLGAVKAAELSTDTSPAKEKATTDAPAQATPERPPLGDFVLTKNSECRNALTEMDTTSHNIHVVLTAAAKTLDDQSGHAIFPEHELLVLLVDFVRSAIRVERVPGENSFAATRPETLSGDVKPRLEVLKASGAPGAGIPSELLSKLEPMVKLGQIKDEMGKVGDMAALKAAIQQFNDQKALWEALGRFLTRATSELNKAAKAENTKKSKEVLAEKKRKEAELAAAKNLLKGAQEAKAMSTRLLLFQWSTPERGHPAVDVKASQDALNGSGVFVSPTVLQSFPNSQAVTGKVMEYWTKSCDARAAKGPFTSTSADFPSVIGKKEFMALINLVADGASSMVHDSLKSSLREPNLFYISPGAGVVDRPKSWLGQLFVCGEGDMGFLSASVQSLMEFLEKSNLKQDGAESPSYYAQAQAWMLSLLTPSEELDPCKKYYDLGLRMYSGKLGKGEAVILPPGYVTVMCGLNGKCVAGAYTTFLAADPASKNALQGVMDALRSGAAFDSISAVVTAMV